MGINLAGILLKLPVFKILFTNKTMVNKLNQDNGSAELLKCVEKIAIAAKKSEMKSEFFNKNKAELRALSSFLEITDLQAAIFCVMLNLNFGNTSVDLDEIAGYIGSSPVAILGFLPELDEMVSKGIISRFESSRRRKKGGCNVNDIGFYVERTVLDSLGKGVKFSKKNMEIPDVYALLAHLAAIFSDFS